MKVGQLVVLVDDVDGLEAGREGCIMGVRDDMLTVGCQTSERLHLVLAHTWQVLPRELFRRLSAREGGNVMSEENVDARPLTSVELLDAAVWREIDSDEAQPQAAFLEALSRLVGRWLMVRSDAPGMDVVTVLCKARGYIARQEVRQTTNDEIEWRR